MSAYLLDRFVQCGFYSTIEQSLHGDHMEASSRRQTRVRDSRKTDEGA